MKFSPLSLIAIVLLLCFASACGKLEVRFESDFTATTRQSANTLIAENATLRAQLQATRVATSLDSLVEKTPKDTALPTPTVVTRTPSPTPTIELTPTLQSAPSATIPASLGVNVAAGRPVIARAGGVTYASWANANDAVDYKTTTNPKGGRWGNETNGARGSFQIVDLGAVYELVGIGYHLDWDGAFRNSLTFQVAVSRDNETWSVVSQILHPFTGTTGSNKININIPIAPILARYVRYWEPPDNSWNGWGDFFHLRAFSTSATAGSAPRLTSTPTPPVPKTSIPLATEDAPNAPIQPLQYHVIDAAYSGGLDRLIMVSDNPAALHIHDPNKNADILVSLSLAPTSVAISPNGKFAAVGHGTAISYVDLEEATVAKIFRVDIEVLTIVLAGNGWIYALPVGDKWVDLISVEIESSRIVIGPNVRANGIMRLHPNGKYIYYIDIGVFPALMHRHVLGGDGKIAAANDWPYYGQYYPCHNMWFSADGNRIFTSCGNTFFVSPDINQDMTYAGSLNRLRALVSVAHVLKSEQVLAIAMFPSGVDQPLDDSGKNYLSIFDYGSLNLLRQIPLPIFGAPGKELRAEGRFVFVNAEGTRYYIVVQASKNSGLLNDFGVIVGSLPMGS